MDIIESLSEFLTPDLVVNASKYLGETAGSTARALGITLPAVLAGATEVASRDGGEALADLIKDHAADANTLSNIAGLFGGAAVAQSVTSMGQQALTGLFCQSAGGTATALASFTGIKSSSAGSMLALAAPVVLGLLSRHQARQGLSAAGLARQLGSQKHSVLRLLPPAVGSALGFVPPLFACAASALGATPLSQAATDSTIARAIVGSSRP